MSTRVYIAAVLGLMVAGVLFGIGAIPVLMIPALSAKANLLLPIVVVLSIVLTPPIAWKLAPKLRAKPHAP
ncbi:hypothetical protein [Phenylobacterium sp.]|uniref:hypothetical protein n=1 Tax=Phenylobacterium sp. TaxID=1871053 RepID=UPI0027237407|nr:hypothetical protein [Phenylobacterium sp.]MDO8802290.1 hypothetical protein [Phenylobacterium sp.]